MIERIPENETLEKWSIMSTTLIYKNVKIAKTEQIVAIFKAASESASKDSKLTVLESNDSAKNIWVLFKVETPKYPNDPKPESQLYYAIQGDVSLYVNFVAVKEKKLSQDFVDKWSKIFKESKFVN